LFSIKYFFLNFKSTTNLFWSFLLQYMFLGIEANIYGFSGAILIFIAAILNVLVKIIDQRFKKNSSNVK
jgi:hypothetical protein